MALTYQSEFGELKSVLLKHPRDAFGLEANVEEAWTDLYYTGKPDLSKALEEYDGFVDIFKKHGIETLFLPEH